MFYVTKNCLEFWDKVEANLGIDVPHYIKNILCLAGYRSAITIRNISEKDFNYLEEFSESIPNMIINFLKTHSITSKKVDLDQISKCFMRLNFIDEKATFLQDDKNLVLHVVSYVNQKLGSGKDFYKSLSLFTKKSVFVRSTRSLVKTKVGLLFCPKPNNEQLLPTQAAPASSTNTRSFNASLKETRRSKCFNASSELDNVEQDLEDMSLDEITLDIENIHEMRSGTYFENLVKCYQRNRERSKHGHRFDIEHKMFCAYIRLLSGKLAYETMHANMPKALPSISTVDLFIDQTQAVIREGVLRADELLAYLNAHDLPLAVGLSEDATRISNRIQYDSKSNMLVGFVLETRNDNGMFVTDQFEARSAKDIEDSFFEIVDNRVYHRASASLVTVVMAQPLSKTVPPFCLLLFGTDNTFTSENVSKRWTFCIDELKKKNISVLSIATDSDGRYNSLMRKTLEFGDVQCENTFPAWFNCGSDVEFIPIQDPIHIGTKFRNNMFKDKLSIGKFKIRVEHLRKLITRFSKDRHNLVDSTLDAKDKQNFDSVLRITNPRVTKLLEEEIPSTEGTVLFLKILDKILRAMLDESLNPLEIIHLIWYGTFALRIWRKSVVVNKTKTKGNFLPDNSYSCVEINAHSIVLYMILLKATGNENLFFPGLLGSQQCESTFRQIRSLTSTFSTITEFSLLQIMQRIKRIHFLNSVAHDKSTRFKFPRIGIRRHSFYNSSHSSTSDNSYQQLPSQQQIFEEIECAKKEAIQDMKKLGVFFNSEELICELKYTKKDPANQNIPTQAPLEPTEISDDTQSLKYFDEIELKNYSEKLGEDEVIDEQSPYVSVMSRSGKKIVVKKGTLVWLFSKSYEKLSSDRLKRVQARIDKKQSA